jgi:hypothetical protein
LSGARDSTQLPLWQRCSLPPHWVGSDTDSKLDDKGKCRDDHGKFAKQMLCVQHSYKLDSKNKCRDEKGKFADAKFCHG